MKQEARLAIFLIALLIGVTVAINVLQARNESVIPLDSASERPLGAKALRLWLDEMGYRTSTRTLTNFAPPAGTSVVLMLEPSSLITNRELETLEEWVENGGTLFVAGDGQGVVQVADYFLVDSETVFASNAAVTALHPRMQAVASWDALTLSPNIIFEPNTDDVVPLLTIDDGLVALALPLGEGIVLLSALDEPFANFGIEENAELALNLLTFSGAVDEGTIWFDEWHHGVRTLVNPDAIIGPNAWLRQTRQGQALIYAGLLLFVMLLWQGRRFGRTIPLQTRQTRRAPLEYVTAIANLNRRADNRAAVLADYKRRFKRQLGARYQIDPTQPDPDFLAALQRVNGHLDLNEIETVLQRLNGAKSEGEMVAISAEVADWLKETHR